MGKMKDKSIEELYNLEGAGRAELEEFSNARRDREMTLWAAQLEAWPESVRLPIQDVFRWCDKGPTMENKKMRWASVSLALQEDCVVFYRTKKEGGYMGYRYGTNGSEYVSGFNCLEGGCDEAE
jgi:hypothetical protein